MMRKKFKYNLVTIIYILQQLFSRYVLLVYYYALMYVCLLGTGLKYHSSFCKCRYLDVGKWESLIKYTRISQ